MNQMTTIHNAANLRRLIEATAEAAGVTFGDLTGPRRTQRISKARAICVGICRRAGYSIPEIGRALSRNYTTIINCQNRANELMATDSAARDLALSVGMANLARDEVWNADRPFVKPMSGRRVETQRTRLARVEEMDDWMTTRDYADHFGATMSEATCDLAWLRQEGLVEAEILPRQRGGGLLARYRKSRDGYIAPERLWPGPFVAARARAMFARIIIQAVGDAYGLGCTELERQQAISWFGTKDFREICECAGICPDAFMDRWNAGRITADKLREAMSDDEKRKREREAAARSRLA